MINLNRLKNLIAGTEEPDSHGEHIFLEAYQAGLHGRLQYEHLISRSAEVEYFDVDDFHYFVIGYSLGQREHQETMDILDSIDVDDDNGNNYH